MKARILILTALLAVGIPPLQAATITVTTTNDSGPGSLRAALASAANGDTIDATGLSGSILLTSGELLVTNSLTILGPGPAALAVNGNFPNTTNRVFHLTNAVTVAISGLTITNGHATGSPPVNSGGGIYNDHSTLTVSNCTLSGNSTGFFGYGGGIYNAGRISGSATLTIIASTLSSNSADLAGGGIYNDGVTGSATLTIANSTLSGNSAGAYGGGIYNDAASSGIAALTIIASTLSGNSAGIHGGGIYNNGGSGNATLGIVDTILNAGVGLNIYNDAGTVTSSGYNLSSNGGVVNVNGGTGFLAATGDQTFVDPMLGPLADNGGPTPTMALRAGSPAIDKGNSSGLTTDQRGQPRPYDDPNVSNATGGDGSDIGAYEASEFRITNAQKTGNHLRLDFTSLLGTNYEVQSRSNLNAGSWGSLGVTNAGNGGIVSTTVSNAFGQSHQFYRIHPVP